MSKMNRKKRAAINILFSLLLEVVTIMSGLIVPRLIIQTYGSNGNGLVNSITSFIGYIALLQSGIGAVIRAALYKPLAKKDHIELVTIVKTTERFFTKIAYLSIAYIVFLAVAFPAFIVKEFHFWYVFSLVLIIGISTAAQYFFGITYQMVLEADQSSFIYSIIQIGTVILNTICSVILVSKGFSIQFVRLVSAIFFVIRPLLIGIYTKKKYKLYEKVKPDNKLISQRWDGMAQGIAYFIHTKTDIFVLTLFSSLENISVYSVYALVTSGLTAIINSIDKAVKAVLGNIYANDVEGELEKNFSVYLNILHIISTVLFATASITVFNFVSIYTHDVSDAQYIQPIFATLIISAESLYCMRMPYNAVINVSGKFKETKKSAILEAIINIGLSCILVPFFGLIGVAIGTWIAMAYRTISFIVFLHSNVLYLNYKEQIVRYLTTLLSYVVCLFIGMRIHVQFDSYFTWAIYALIVLIGVAVVTITINMVVMRKNTVASIKYLFCRKK